MFSLQFSTFVSHRFFGYQIYTTCLYLFSFFIKLQYLDLSCSLEDMDTTIGFNYVTDFSNMQIECGFFEWWLHLSFAKKPKSPPLSCELQSLSVFANSLSLTSPLNILSKCFFNICIDSSLVLLIPSGDFQDLGFLD